MTSRLAWMILGADTAGELATARAAGATHGLVEVFWDQCQTTNGGAVTATAVLANVQRVLDAGMKVCLRVSLQYIPTFVDTAAVKFRRNGAVDHNPGNVSGNNARDWVWSAATRALVDDFLVKLFNQIDWTKIDRVQLGGGPAGELQYPDSDGTQWWGFSAPAQTGTGLASGQVVCPVPGHVPSTGTTWTANDIAFAAWYTQSLTNWMLWLIGKHRAYFAGPIWVMHPGAGLRKVSQTPTGGQALNYRVNLAKGVDWDHQIAAYPDAAVHPYCTWADAEHFWPPDPFDDVDDGNAAPWYHLLRIARTRGRGAQIWGENTGGQSNTDMDRVFTSGAVALGYQGLGWLSHDSLADGTSDTYANLTTRIALANRASGTYRRGVNMAGGEFAPSAATLPGVYGTDYSYDSAAALAAVAGRGHKIVRLPFRWERIQPTRNAALNTAELARLQAVVADATTAGMRVVLDCHNYARYINSTANGGAELVLGTTLPASDLVDLWTRLSTAFKDVGGVGAYGLMNEPHDLVGTTGSFSGTTRYDWVSGVQGWTGDSATASNVSGKLRLSGTATSGFFLLRKDDAATVSGGSTPTGNVLRFEATLVTNPGGSWTAKAQWQNSSFAWQNPTSVSYNRVDTGAAVSGLVAGVAVHVTCTFASITSPPNAFAVQIESNAATAGAVAVDIDNFAQGSLVGGATAAEVWENASQQVVTAIRSNGDAKKILVSGYNWSGAKDWQTTHPDPWITDPANNTAYEAHYYFDIDNSGDYPDSYATENAAAVTAGHASLAARAVTELQNWTSWLSAYGVRGFLGETGWPNTGDTTGWNGVGDAVYAELDRHSVEATYWSAGERWGSTYNLSIYVGATQATIRSQAATVEAHPSLESNVVTFRAATDDARGTTTNTDPALPVGTVAGDLLIAIQASDTAGSLAAMTAPVGWTLVGSSSRTDVGFVKVWTKTAGVSEPATYTFVDSTAAHANTIVMAVTGHNPSVPLAVSPVFANGAASTSHVAPSTTGAVDDLLVTAYVAGTAGTTRNYTSQAAPTGMTNAEQSTLTSAGNVLSAVYYQELSAGGATGTRTATPSASTPWVAVSLVVVAPVAQTVSPTGITSGQAFGTATVTVAAAPAQTVTAVGIASGQAFGVPLVQVSSPGFSSGLYPSESLFPSETLFPSDGNVQSPQTVTVFGFDAVGAIGVPALTVDLPPDQTVTAAGITSGEAFGTAALSLANGPQTVSPTPIDTAEAFGTAVVTVAVASQTIFAIGFEDPTDFGLSTVTVSFTPPVQSGPSYHDTYYLDGIDLSSLVSQIEVAEGLQDVMGSVGDNVVLPGLDGELSVWGEPGQPRRTDGPGRLILNMWMFGVDPNTGEVTTGDHPAEDWFREWDKVVRRFRRRRLTIDHPRPDGTRRAIAHYAVGESMEPTDRSAGSPWFGRYKAVLTIPAAHWTDIDPVTASASLPNNGVLSLGAFAEATAPCTELIVTFGQGNNPRLSTSYNHIGYNGTIAPGQQLTINTATGLLGTGGGSAWAPNYANLTLAPGPRLFEVDPSEPLSAVLTHTGGGSMSVEVAGKRRYRTS